MGNRIHWKYKFNNLSSPELVGTTTLKGYGNAQSTEVLNNRFGITTCGEAKAYVLGRNKSNTNYFKKTKMDSAFLAKCATHVGTTGPPVGRCSIDGHPTYWATENQCIAAAEAGDLTYEWYPPGYQAPGSGPSATGPEGAHGLYSTQGLTYKTNLPMVCKRNKAGNIDLTEGKANNQLLIFESTKENFSNKSVINAIDTQFKYYKFPASITVEDTGFDLAEIDFEIDGAEKPDLIKAHYTIPYIPPTKGYQHHYRRISTNYESSWYTNDSDHKTSGAKRMPFTTAMHGPQQSTPGTYTITPEIYKVLRTYPYPNLKFRIKVSCVAAKEKPTEVLNAISTIQEAGGVRGLGGSVVNAINNAVPTSQYDQGVETWFTMELRKDIMDWRGSMGHTQPHMGPPLQNERPYKDQDNREHWNPDWARSPSGQWIYNHKYPPTVSRCDIHQGQQFIGLIAEYIVHPRDIQPWDTWFVAVKANHKAYYLANSSYFDVELIDPIHPGNDGGTVFENKHGYDYIPARTSGPNEGWPDVDKKIHYPKGTMFAKNLPGYGLQATCGKTGRVGFLSKYRRPKEGPYEGKEIRTNQYQSYMGHLEPYPYTDVDGIPD